MVLVVAVAVVVVVGGSVREGFKFVLHRGALLYKMGWVTSKTNV